MRTPARHLIWAPALLVLGLIGGVLATSPMSTYGGASEELTVLAGLGVVALLVLASLTSDAVRYWALAVAATTWMVPELAGWAAGSEMLRTAADSWARLLPGLVLLGVAPDAPGTTARVLTRTALLAGAVAAATRLLLVDPFRQLDCWRTCARNPLLIGAGAGLGPWIEALAVLVGAAAAAGMIASWSRSGRRRTPVGTIAAGTVVLGLGGSSTLRLVIPESAASPAYLALFVMIQTAAVALASTEGAERLARWHLRGRLTRLAGAITATGPTRAPVHVLREALRDPELTVVYRASGHDGFVDAEGRDTDRPVAAPGRKVTTVTRRGQPVAAVVHTAAVGGERLERALGSALRLALENEQLRASALAELAELKRSRARIVERGALERRRLERNLHDGAQQRVVSLALLVRMLAGRVDGGPAATEVGRAETLTRVIVEELRRLARGIYPAVLADAGLAGAVLELAESSVDLAVRVDGIPERRYRRTIETTGYLTVAGALADARVRGATRADVCGEERDGTLVLDVRDDAPQRSGSLRAVADEVDALFGRLLVEPCAGGTHVRLELPCAS